MLSQEFFTHYPSRLLWFGAAMLSLLIVLTGTVLFPVIDLPHFPLPGRQGVVENTKSLHPFGFENAESSFPLAIPSLNSFLLISLSPSRPNGERNAPTAHVRVKETEQSGRLSLPGRIYLSFNQGALSFEKYEGPFWMDLSLTEDESLMARVVIVRGGKETCSESFTRRADEPSIQKSEEFPVGSSIRVLGDSFWWGADLLSQLNSSQMKQRFEIGAKQINLAEDEWITWKEDRWMTIKDISEAQDQPIARIRSITPQQIEWDVWDASYVRLSTPLQTAPANNHIKPEELLASLRIRSEKQISCVIEKQCFILRVGDWILKENGRWHVLRRAEDRQQLIKGNKVGELLILDKIDPKQKTAKGRLFLATRVQMIPIESKVALSKQDKKRRIGEHIRSGKNI